MRALIINSNGKAVKNKKRTIILKPRQVGATTMNKALETYYKKNYYVKI